MKRASGVLDSVKIARFDDLIECVVFLDILNNRIGKLVGFEQVNEVVALVG